MALDGFGYKTAWLAVRCVTPATLASALALRDVQPCEWPEGVEASYGDGRLVFVTPSIGDWTLCTGTVLLETTDGRPPDFPEVLIGLAARLGTMAQFFASHRVVELQAWGRATPDGVERAYMYVGESGETVLDLGPQTREEEALGFRFFDSASPDADADGYWEREDLSLPDEESVMRLAAAWSVEPSTLPGDLAPGGGLVGKYGRTETPSLTPPEPPTHKKRWGFW